jgi:catechol 2,3-dioxygenase-like lactoylglutathione lyase family enzyme
MNSTLEVVVVPVLDVDHAKAFYAEQLGFNVDQDTKVREGDPEIGREPQPSAGSTRQCGFALLQ